MDGTPIEGIDCVVIRHKPSGPSGHRRFIVSAMTPFNPSTEISYTLQSDADVKLNVYDLRGSLVARLVDEKQVAGTHTVTWDASGLASGIYFCRLEADGYVGVQRLVLLK
jgi:hypothetical protein